MKPVLIRLAILLTMASPGARVAFGEMFPYSGDVTIHYEKFGHGPTPVVLLHGLAASGESWGDVLPLLDCRCTFYVLDLKGHGDSSKPLDRAYDVTDHAAIVQSFLDSENLRDPILVGHSFGGAVALRTAMSNNRVRALVLIGTPGVKQRFPIAMTQLRHQKTAAFFERFTPTELAAVVGLRRVYYDKSALTPVHIERYARLWRDRAGNRATRETGAKFLSRGLKQLDADLGKVQVPALVIAGEKDWVVQAKHQRELARRLHSAEYVEIPNCGHVPHEECPARAAELLNAFLQKQASRPVYDAGAR